MPAVASLVALVATLALGAWAAAVQAVGTWRWGPGLELGLEVSGFGRAMVVLVPAIALPVVAWAAVTSTEDPSRPRLLGLLVGFVGAMELLVSAADLLTLLVGWELVAACSWALISHDWRDPERPRAALAAFLTTRVGDLGLYLAAGAALAGGGSLRFAQLGGARRPELDVVAAGVLVAATAKSAQLPFSPWLFSAMAGPTPVSALLHSATMVAAGAYALVRLAPAFAPLGWFEPTVAGVGLATAIAGGMVASLQPDFKRALAGSTSAQYGLMFLAVGSGATGAAGTHLVAHAAFKAPLFLGAGTALHAAGTLDLAHLRLGRVLPRAAVLVGIPTLALAAVPPLGGAFSKEAVLAAAAERSGALGAVGLVAGFLSAFYAARLFLLAYGPGPARYVAHVDEAELAPLGVLAALSVALGLLWLPGGRQVAERLTAGPVPQARLTELGLSLATATAGIGLALRLDRRGRLVSLGLPLPLAAYLASWLGLPALARRAVVNPVLAITRLLARVDDQVVDAGVRAAGGLATEMSRLLSTVGELSLDRIVRVVAGGALRSASTSRIVEERAVDATVEVVAAGVGVAGRHSRRLQGGLSHRYYLILAAGLLVVVAVAAAWR